MTDKLCFLVNYSQLFSRCNVFPAVTQLWQYWILKISILLVKRLPFARAHLWHREVGHQNKWVMVKWEDWRKYGVINGSFIKSGEGWLPAHEQNNQSWSCSRSALLLAWKQTITIIDILYCYSDSALKLLVTITLVAIMSLEMFVHFWWNFRSVYTCNCLAMVEKITHNLLACRLCMNKQTYNHKRNI